MVLRVLRAVLQDILFASPFLLGEECLGESVVPLDLHILISLPALERPASLLGYFPMRTNVEQIPPPQRPEEGNG